MGFSLQNVVDFPLYSEAWNNNLYTLLLLPDPSPSSPSPDLVVLSSLSIRSADLVTSHPFSLIRTHAKLCLLQESPNLDEWQSHMRAREQCSSSVSLWTDVLGWNFQDVGLGTFDTTPGKVNDLCMSHSQVYVPI